MKQSFPSAPKVSGFGWPMVPSKAFPGELTNGCPTCGSTDVTITGAYAARGTGPCGRGRLGDPGGSSWLLCNGCGAKSEPLKDSKS